MVAVALGSVISLSWFVLLQVITGQPEVNKIALLSRIRGLFQTNPFVAGFGNKVTNTYLYIREGGIHSLRHFVH